MPRSDVLSIQAVKAEADAESSSDDANPNQELPSPTRFENSDLCTAPGSGPKALEASLEALQAPLQALEALEAVLEASLQPTLWREGLKGFKKEQKKDGASGGV